MVDRTMQGQWDECLIWKTTGPGRGSKAIGNGQPDAGDELDIMQGRQPITYSPGFHVALGAPSRASVVAFHAAALAAGGTDNGPPGLRPGYGPTYFAAFVMDPEGHRLEAVCKTAV